jgi:glycosyltransferase involved in cell wall biosynthesis
VDNVTVVQIGDSDGPGGAAKAMMRIHHAINDSCESLQCSSEVYVAHKVSDDPTVKLLPDLSQLHLSSIRKAYRRVQQFVFNRRLKRFKTTNSTFHSFARHRSYLVGYLDDLQADILNFHWLGSRVLSIEEIAQVEEPIVWTLHDQWAFCGAEHYASPSLPVDRRYVDGYTKQNRRIDEAGPDLNRETWERKIRSWVKPMHVVCPSRWMADCTRESVLMRDWPISVIPYPIDVDRWRPVNRDRACQDLLLNPEKNYLLFGACGGTSDPRKGGDLLKEALHKLAGLIPNNQSTEIELMVFGEAGSKVKPPWPFKTHFFGNIDRDEDLVNLYSIADVMLIPSRQDNLPNTGIEAHACGTPIISFEIGGMSDIVDQSMTGYLVPPFDTSAFAAAIQSIVSDSILRSIMNEAARRRAVALWSPEIIARSYYSLYESILRSL